MGRKQPTEMRGDPADVAFFDLMNSHLPRTFSALMRRLPSEPRCRLCRAPYGGVGGRIMRRVGFGPSRKNPNLCNTCFEKAPMGGVEMEIGVLFADIRGFTAMAESMTPNAVAELLNRFYATASDVLEDHAIIDKLVGDEVMALYIPLLVGDGWEQRLMTDASRLLAAVGFGSAAGPWLQLGVGLDVGPAFVGNVGSGEVKDFTALGDVVNTASRLQANAAPGQIVLSQRLHDRLPTNSSTSKAMMLELKGKNEPQAAHVIDVGAV
jgi:adenylate cyclase